MSAVVILITICFTALLTVPPHGARQQFRRHAKTDNGWRKKSKSISKDLDMGIILTEVATRLRSGAGLEKAWGSTLQRRGIRAGAGSEAGGRRGSRKNNSDAPAAQLEMAGSVLDESGVPRALRAIWNLGKVGRWRKGVTPVAGDALPATFAVCRIGHATGAPMAEIFDSCALGITEAGEARSARQVALAGPQASARMLAVLPLVGIALGYVMGADPFGFLLGTVWGHLALIAALCFEIAGVFLVRNLVHKAMLEAEEK